MLLAEQLRTYLMELLRLPGAITPPRHIVLHRDGRVWLSERTGARQAIAELSEEGVLAPDATLTILEVSKSAPAPLRLFEVTGDARRPWVENPQVGAHLIAGNDAYLCATGRPFRHPGTVNPLHVRYVEGGLPFARGAEDLYALTTLAWTRPDDCTREPITIKLNDRRLGEDATEYDADALDFAPGHEGETRHERYRTLLRLAPPASRTRRTARSCPRAPEGGDERPQTRTARRWPPCCGAWSNPRRPTPSVRMLALVLRGHAKALVKGWGAVVEALIATVPVPGAVVERLETLALALDDERAGAAKRMRGVRP